MLFRHLVFAAAPLLVAGSAVAAPPAAGKRPPPPTASSVATPVSIPKGAGGAVPKEVPLEVRVWTSDEHELPRLEHDVVRWLQLDPSSPIAHQLLSRVYVRIYAKDPSDLYLLRQASDLAQQAIDLAPRDAAGYVALADILDLMGNGDRALRLLDEAEASGVHPNWRFYFARARLTADGAPAAETLKLLETALAFTDAEPRIVVPYVIAILQSEDSSQGMEGAAHLLARLEEWNKRFPSPLFDLTAGMTLTETKHPAEAHAVYTKLLTFHPDMKEARVNDAILRYRYLNDPKGAVAQLSEVLKSHHADLTGNLRATVTAHLGAAQVAQKAWKDARESFIQAAALDRDNMSVLDFVTRTYRDAKAHAELAATIDELNDRVPGTGVLYALLGETLSEHLARHDEALRAFADAIILDPERSDYYNGMGLAYYRKRSYPEALRLFVAAGEIDPNDATARYNEACVLSLLGRGEEALASLGEALALDPRLSQTARNDADFAGIKTDLKFRELVEAGAGVEPDTEVGH